MPESFEIRNFTTNTIEIYAEPAPTEIIFLQGGGRLRVSFEGEGCLSGSLSINIEENRVIVWDDKVTASIVNFLILEDDK